MSEIYTYAVVRSDVPLGDQFCQLGHACLTSGRKFKVPYESNIVCSYVKNEEALFKLADKLESNGIKFHLFYEPDINEHTAICTEGIHRSNKGILRKIQLIK